MPEELRESGESAGGSGGQQQGRSKTTWCLKLPNNRRQRKNSYIILIVVSLDIIDSLMEFYEPMKSFFTQIVMHGLSEPSLSDLIMYNIRGIFDIILSLTILYIGQMLSQKRNRKVSSSHGSNKRGGDNLSASTIPRISQLGASEVHSAPDGNQTKRQLKTNTLNETLPECSQLGDDESCHSQTNNANFRNETNPDQLQHLLQFAQNNNNLSKLPKNSIESNDSSGMKKTSFD